MMRRLFWDEVTTRDTAAYYRAYLEQYPTGRFASIAKLNLRHGATAAAAKQVASLVSEADKVVEASVPRMAIYIPDAMRDIPGTPQSAMSIKLVREKRKDMQLRPTALGHDTKGSTASLVTIRELPPETGRQLIRVSRQPISHPLNGDC